MTDPKKDEFDDDQPQGQDPLAAFLSQMGMPANMDLNALVQQVGTLFGTSSPGQQPTGDDWGWLKHMVRQMSAAMGPDPSPTSPQQRQMVDAVRLAETWLDDAVEFPAVSTPPAVWSRAEWIEASFDSWRPLAEPVIKALARSLGQGAGGAGPSPEAGDPMGMITTMLAPMMENLARHMYGAQFARALAELSNSVVSASDVGLQVTPPRVALLSSNIDKHFGELQLSPTDVWLYVALREAARQRLFAHAAWLGPQLQALIEHYARETRIDMQALAEGVDLDAGGLDPARLGEMSEQLQDRLFDPEPTPEQAEILDRLHTVLALVEGWVDHVVTRAAERWMPHQAALAEAVRRRRASGGASEEALKKLIGLELKPRRVRDASNLWAAVLDARGQAARDALWAHPDVLPTAADLDDPIGFARGEATATPETDEWDRGLEQLLREEGRD